MTDLEKLLELIAIGGFFSRSADAEKCADYLIANGVAPVVHGRWVLVKPRRTGRNATYKCTACGQLRSSYYNDVTKWKHCPCGARMDGGEG